MGSASVNSIDWATITPEEWTAIQTLCEIDLEPQVRASLEACTRSFISAAEFEQSGASIAEARVELEGIKRLISELVSKLDYHRPSDGLHHAQHLLRNHIRDPLLGSVSDVPPYKELVPDPLSIRFMGVLRSVLAAADAGLLQLEDTDWQRVEGEAWIKWIRDLSTVMRSARKPYGARNDGGRSSRFVRLVSSLQKRLPGYQRHTQSEEALSKAIERARKKGRKPPSSGKSGQKGR